MKNLNVLSYAVLASFPGRLPLQVAYVTFEPQSDKRQKAWYHSYVIYKQGGHGCEATQLHICSSSLYCYHEDSNLMPTQR